MDCTMRALRDSLPTFLPDSLRDLAKIISLRKGQYLFHAGQPVDAVYYLFDGEIKAVGRVDDGLEVTLIQVGGGEFFAESELADAHHSFDAVAISPCRVAVLPTVSIKQCVKEGGECALAFVLALSSNSHKQCARFQRLRLKKARDRILDYLVCHGGTRKVVEFNSPLLNFAHDLGLAPESLYRALAELESEGLVKREGVRLYLL